MIQNRQLLNLILIAGLGIYLLCLSLFTVNSLDDTPVSIIKNEDLAVPIQPSEVAIVTYYAAQKNSSHRVHYSNNFYSKVANITMTNLARYSQKHGHAFFFMNADMVDTNSRAAYWGKMDVIDHYMNLGFKWVIWTDIDVLFMDFSRSIFEEWIKPAKGSTHLLFVNECISKRNISGPIRSGFFAVRNSHHGRLFLDSWKQTFSRYKKRQNPEQAALEDMIKAEKWSNVSEIASHLNIHTYPKCYNGTSISLHFPGAMKKYVNDYSKKVKVSTALSEFLIVVPGN